ncbi:MAG: ADP-ribosylation factor-like protein [Acidobacteriota bacterium]
MQQSSTQDNEITAKVVYYGPGLSGKTTCFQYLYRTLPAQSKGKLLSLATNIDRTIYFDFMPLKLDRVQGLNLRIQLYTVPGQVRFNATRKMVLKDVDALVFVADMQRQMLRANQESLKNLAENLRDYHQELRQIPHVFQYNKEDLADLLSAEELNEAINAYAAPAFVTCALTGKGVMESLKAVTRLLIADIKTRRERGAAPQGRVRPSVPSRPRRVGLETDTASRKLVAGKLAEPKATPAESIERRVREGAFEEVASWSKPSPKSEAHAPAPEVKDVNATQSIASLQARGTPAEERGGRDVSDTSKATILRPKSASLAPLFKESVQRRAYQELEGMIAAGGASLSADAFGAKALALLDTVLKDEALFPEKDGPTSPATRLNVLGVRYGRYLRFQSILGQGGGEPLARDAALACLHFLVDVLLAKGEVGR